MAKINPTDRAVGARMRLRSRELGLSAAKIGKRLGISSTQVTKYGDGSNRISAGRLLEIARLLRVPVSYFFQSVSCAPASPPAIAVDEQLEVFARTEEAGQLSAAFSKIGSAALRRHVISLVRALADEGES